MATAAPAVSAWPSAAPTVQEILGHLPDDVVAAAPPAHRREQQYNGLNSLVLGLIVEKAPATPSPPNWSAGSSGPWNWATPACPQSTTRRSPRPMRRCTSTDRT
ncbi:hypothetical protein [Streptomyces sp. NRRL S-813]|uniref:hypothetical protein n=1 Tax=Streptomyces sp. NRRL S-813 TaxID=1463919 RepID=UPI000AC46154|nr:hypothetical protein [Streptomyces sp. NRRL S-813]